MFEKNAEGPKSCDPRQYISKFAFLYCVYICTYPNPPYKKDSMVVLEMSM